MIIYNTTQYHEWLKYVFLLAGSYNNIIHTCIV